MKKQISFSMLSWKIEFTLSDLLFSLIPSGFFLLITYKFWGQSPALDPMVIYRESTQFYNTGLNELSKMGYSIHPPLLYIINTGFFHVFGNNPGSYNLAGFSILLATSVAFFFFIKDVFNRRVAALASVFLFCNPLVVVNAFLLGNDFLILSGLVFSLIAFTYKRYVMLSIVLSLMVLMKESALMVILGWGTVMMIETLYRIFVRKEAVLPLIIRFSVFLLPLITFVTWRNVLKSYGLAEWRENSLIESKDSSFVLVAKNLFTLGFLNKFFKGNLENLFVFNYQWLYTGLLPILAIATYKTRKFVKSRQQLVIFALGLISFLYILLVLSFQTFTVLRYSIPVFLIIFLLLAVLVDSIKPNHIKSGLAFLVLYIILVSNFTSLDPVVKTIHKGEIAIYGQKFYNTSWWYGGPDRIAYNRQILESVSKQNLIIESFLQSNADLLLTYCDELKLGEKVWSISVYNEFYPDHKMHKRVECINDYEIARRSNDIAGKVVYIRRSEYDRIMAILTDEQVPYAGVIQGVEF